MIKLRVDGTNIYITRGDTNVIRIYCTDNEGNPVKFIDGDVVYLTVKENVYTEDKILQYKIETFVDGYATIIIKPEDTKDLSFGYYYYDIQFSGKTGTVKTVIKPSLFSSKFRYG